MNIEELHKLIEQLRANQIRQEQQIIALSDAVKKLKKKMLKHEEE